MSYFWLCTFVIVGMTGSIVIILTPLISLMMNQKEKFVKRGIQAEFCGEAQDNKEAIGAVIKGEIQLVYISPENLLCNLQFLLSGEYKNNLHD